AVTLDALARELGVLFIVPTGNFQGADSVPADWRAEYPGYLLQEEAALLDPAPALNALTVGSLARWDATFNAQRYQDDPAEQPIARRDQPSPFTRSGPSVGGAIKPELVAYGGNRAVNLRVRNHWPVKHGLGELSTCKDFAAGRPFAEDAGTSFAAPTLPTWPPASSPNILTRITTCCGRCSLLMPAGRNRARSCFPRYPTSCAFAATAGSMMALSS